MPPLPHTRGCLPPACPPRPVSPPCLPARSLSTGQKVTVVGFGTFEARTRAARKGRNPATGAELFIPETTAPAFSAGGCFIAHERPTWQRACCDLGLGVVRRGVWRYCGADAVRTPGRRLCSRLHDEKTSVITVRLLVHRRQYLLASLHRASVSLIMHRHTARVLCLQARPSRSG